MKNAQNSNKGTAKAALGAVDREPSRKLLAFHQRPTNIFKWRWNLLQWQILKLKHFKNEYVVPFVQFWFDVVGASIQEGSPNIAS